MSVIRFTAADALQTKVIEAGFYPSQVTKIEGPKASKSGKSQTYFIDIEITEGPYKGKAKTLSFNSSTSSPSLLGDAKFYPLSYMLQVDAAITGREIVPEDFELDTEEIINKPFETQWVIVTVEGRPINDIIGFFTSGYGKDAPSF